VALFWFVRIIFLGEMFTISYTGNKNIGLISY